MNKNNNPANNNTTENNKSGNVLNVLMIVSFIISGLSMVTMSMGPNNNMSMFTPLYFAGMGVVMMWMRDVVNHLHKIANKK